MTLLDSLLRQWRCSKIRPYLFKGVRVLDIGCGTDGYLFKKYSSYIENSIGIDPGIPQPTMIGSNALLSSYFPCALPDRRFDIISLFAVLEHIPPREQKKIARTFVHYLKPGGHIIITVPSPIVDKLCVFLKKLHLIDAISLEQHYGFETSYIPSLFSNKWVTMIRFKKFQYGLNNLFIFKKTNSGRSHL